MAKKKEFNSIVEDSFNEGYESEPEVTSCPLDENKYTETNSPKNPTRVPSENEILLKKILSGDETIINNLLNYTERSTYYLTDLHRACIDVKAREDFTSKQDVVRSALESYFNEKVVAAAKEELIRKKVMELKKIIEKENK